MKTLLTSWLRTWLTPRSPRRRRLPRRIAASHRATVESLERRSVPAITSSLTGGTLNVVSTGGDPITLATDAAGQVTLNGTDLQSPNGSSIAANSVTSLNVTGSPADDVIDMSGVTLSAFASLNQLCVNGEAGDDLIVSSPFVSSFTGLIGTGSAPANNLATSSSGLTSADINQGFDLRVAGSSSSVSGTTTSNGLNSTSVISSSNGGALGASVSVDRADFGSKGIPEEHFASHFLWQKEPGPLRSSTTAVNLGLTDFAAASLLTAVSVTDKSFPLLSRTETNSQTRNAPEHETNGEDGLIDISTQYPLNLTKRSESDLSIQKSSEPVGDSAVIATRLGVPKTRFGLRLQETQREVPVIFKKESDGGFIELAVDPATRTPLKRSEPVPAKLLSRHDQLDVEIGRWVAFGDAEFLDQVLAQSSPKEMSVSDTIAEPAPDGAIAPRRITWGLALAASAAAILLPPRFNRRIAGVVKSRFQKMRRGLHGILTR